MSDSSTGSSDASPATSSPNVAPYSRTNVVPAGSLGGSQESGADLEDVAPLWTPSESLTTRVDFVNKCLQIAAICTAGVWALLVFVNTIAPGLEPKVNVSGDISWNRAGADVCQANFSLTVKNPGQTSVDIRSAVLKVWVQDLSEEKNVATERPVLQPLGEEPTLIDKTMIAKGPPVFQSENVEPLLSDIATHYPPGMENASSQIILFKELPNTFAFIEVDLDGEGSSWLLWKHEVHNNGYAMDRVCGEKSGSPETKPTVRQEMPKKNLR